jgi:hypothetical protein
LEVRRWSIPILIGEEAASKSLDPGFSSGFDREFTLGITMLNK